MTVTQKRREYDELKAFFVFWETHLTPVRIFSVSDPRNPIRMLAAIEQELGYARASAGLKQAIGDVLDLAKDLTPDFLAAADAALHQANLLTLSSLATRQSGHFKAILRRGKIRSETEFYLVTSALADTGATWTQQENDLMGSMLHAFEAHRS